MRIVDAREAPEQAVAIRMTMLREIGGLPAGHAFPQEMVRRTAEYLAAGQQTTLLAMDGDVPVSCATLCYITLLPTLSHPTGCRAHLMNVYTASAYRGQGLARRLVTALIEEARSRGVTEISLDATAAGRPLYEALGFRANEEGMTKILRP
ncbi:MAG: GNAT family N-acetyltransferase [Christensenellaceae bacterium]|nr:GNAT family N-acetyltransferase [Christensenellaceae bacterium]